MSIGALPGPSWLLPDPDLSETMKQVQLVLLKRLDRPDILPIICSIKAVLSRIGRRSRISRHLEPA